jgi:hypothetical protein
MLLSNTMSEFDMLGGEVDAYGGSGSLRAGDIPRVDIGCEDSLDDLYAQQEFVDPLDSDTSGIGAETDDTYDATGDTAAVDDVAEPASDKPTRYEDNDPDEPVPYVSTRAMLLGQDVAARVEAFAGVRMSEARTARAGAIMTGEWEFTPEVTRSRVAVEDRPAADTDAEAEEAVDDAVTGGEVDEAVLAPDGLATSIRGLLSEASTAGSTAEAATPAANEATDETDAQPEPAADAPATEAAENADAPPAAANDSTDPPVEPPDAPPSATGDGEGDNGNEPDLTATEAQPPTDGSTAESPAGSAEATEDAPLALKERRYRPGEIREKLLTASDALREADKDMLALLPPRQRAVAKAVMAGDKTNSRIAEELQVRESYVSKIAGRALDTVQRREPDIVTREMIAPTGSLIESGERDNVGSKIDEWRSDLGITRAELESAEVMSTGTQGRLSAGKNHPGVNEVKAYIHYLVSKGMDPAIGAELIEDYRQEYKAHRREIVERTKSTIRQKEQSTETE